MLVPKARAVDPPATWVFAFALLFMTHGAIYLLLPHIHYRTDSLAVYIKYLLLVPLVVGLIAHYWSSPIALSKTVWFCLWEATLCIALMTGAEPLRVALYGIPAVALFMPRSVWEQLPTISLYVLILATIGLLYEYIAIGGFGRFSEEGYRATSIFLNPNNLGIVAVLATYFAMKTCDGVMWWVSVALGVALAIASMSKTGLLLCLILLGYTVSGGQVLRLITGIGALAIAAAAAISLGMVRAPWESGYLRLHQALDFFQRMDGWFFPTVGRLPPYVDNAFLQTWNEMGLLPLLVFICAIAYGALRDRLRSPLWLLFGAAAATTNINYLWPVAYLFWAYIGNGKHDDPV